MIIHINSLDFKPKELTHLVVMVDYIRYEWIKDECGDPYNNEFLFLLEKIADEKFGIKNIGLLNPKFFEDKEALINDLQEREVFGIFMETGIMKEDGFDLLKQILKKFNVRFVEFDVNIFFVADLSVCKPAKKEEIRKKRLLMIENMIDELLEQKEVKK
jgi:hypothetical protein